MPRIHVRDTKSSIVSTVQTPLGFFVLVVLVVEAGLMLLASQAATGDRSYLYSIVGLLVLLIMVVATTAIVKPEALSGQRESVLEENFAESLGKDVFEAFDGYVSNDSEEERAQAYEYLIDVCSSSRYYNDQLTKSFAVTFVDTVVSRADVKRKPRIPVVISQDE